MPFRARMKRAFGRSGSSSSSSSDLSKVKSRGIGDPNVYQPGEPMPKPKYRQPVDKKHKENLESFSFGNNWRRRSASSIASLYSPMGSRLPSRNNSINGPRSFMKRGKSGVGKVIEGEDDDADVSNVGGTSTKHSTTHTRNASIIDPKLQNYEHVGNAHDHQPFSETDIHQALTKTASRLPQATL